MDLKNLRKSGNLVDSGIWITWPDADPDDDTSPRILIRADSYVPYKRKLESEWARKQAFFKKNPDASVDYLNRLLADFIWIRSENLELEGKPIGDDPESKFAVLKEFPEVQRWITSEYDRAANFQAEADAENADAIKSVHPMEDESDSGNGRVSSGASRKGKADTSA